MIPARDAGPVIQAGGLQWLEGCSQPVLFVLDPGDSATRQALDAWLASARLHATIFAQRRPRLSGALNDALDTISTRYVHWCGVDDAAYWQRYPDLARFLGGRTPTWVVGRCDTRRWDGRRTAAGLYRNALHGFTPWLLPVTNSIGCPAIIFQVEVARQLGGFDEAVPAAMDYDLWIRLFARERPVMYPESLGRFTVVPESLTRAHRRASVDDCYRSRRRYFRKPWIPWAAKQVQAVQLKLQDLMGE